MGPVYHAICRVAIAATIFALHAVGVDDFDDGQGGFGQLSRPECPVAEESPLRPRPGIRLRMAYGGVGWESWRRYWAGETPVTRLKAREK